MYTETAISSQRIYGSIPLWTDHLLFSFQRPKSGSFVRSDPAIHKLQGIAVSKYMSLIFLSCKSPFIPGIFRCHVRFLEGSFGTDDLDPPFSA